MAEGLLSWVAKEGPLEKAAQAEVNDRKHSDMGFQGRILQCWQMHSQRQAPKVDVPEQGKGCRVSGENWEDYRQEECLSAC